MPTSALSAKERITRAAKDLFIQKGYHATSIRDIARSSEVQISLIYHYFENKVCLWQKIKTDIIESQHAQNQITESEHADNLTLETFLTSLVTKRFTFFKSNHEMLRIFDWQRLEAQGERLIGSQPKSKNTTKSNESIDDQIRQLQQRGEIRPDLPIHHIIYMISGIVFGPFMRTGNCELKSEIDEKNYIKTTIQTLTLALKPASH